MYAVRRMKPLFFLTLLTTAAVAQDFEVKPPSLDRPLVFDSATRGPEGVSIPGPKFRVVAIQGFNSPYALAFLPNGDMLVTERGGKLRLLRGGKDLDPEPIAGVPEVINTSMRGMNDIALHPHYSENHWIYFTYYKPVPGSTNGRATLARAHYEGGRALSDVQELLSTDEVIAGASAAKIAFGPDGKIYMAIGVPLPRPASNPASVTQTDAQNPNSLYGKILRLNDDGTAAKDNPFAGRQGYRPEIYAMGIRDCMGLYFHPDTGDLWETENGPQGGDEINIIKAGRNYGWPVISYGRAYSGEVFGKTGPVQLQPFAEGMEQPWLFWNPAPSLAALTFYTGDKFPAWKGNIFIGTLVGTRLERVVLSATSGLPIRRQSLLGELKMRIREVKQGRDGLLYLLTEEKAGALLRIEPVDTAR